LIVDVEYFARENKRLTRLLRVAKLKIARKRGEGPEGLLPVHPE
jgi:hypothetical protein